MTRKLGRAVAALAAVALASPGFLWAADAVTRAAGCCGLPCCR